MEISKQLLVVILILFVFVASGCFKELAQPDFAEPDSEFIKEESGFIKEEDVGDIYTSSAPGESGREGKGLLVDGSHKDKFPDSVEPLEPFLPKMGEGRIVSLTQEEEARRRLPFSSSDQLLDMFFAFDMYDLDDQLMAILQGNVAYLKSHSFSSIELQGYCDERGSNNYNISLGEQRAHSVKSYLITLGVDASRIHTISYGEEKPFCYENNEQCWYLNRRVRFLVAE